MTLNVSFEKLMIKETHNLIGEEHILVYNLRLFVLIVEKYFCCKIN